MRTGPLYSTHPEWHIEVILKGPPGNLGVILTEIATVVEKHKGTLSFSEVTAVVTPPPVEAES